MIFGCKNTQIFACGALECGRGSKKLITSLILAKIGAGGAENFRGLFKNTPLYKNTPPYYSRICNKGGVFLIIIPLMVLDRSEKYDETTQN